MTESERFWEKVILPTTEFSCWIWTGAKNSSGYGNFNSSGKFVKAHRWAYEKVTGKRINAVLLHSCDNPGCVNHEHLTDGTQIDNIADMILKGRARRPVPGENHPSAKLSDADVTRIRELKQSGISNAKISVEFGVSSEQVRRIVLNKSRRSV